MSVVGLALAFGCHSSPSGSVRATPVASPARPLPTPVPTMDRVVPAHPPTGAVPVEPSAPPAPLPVRSAAPRAPGVPLLPTAAAVAPRAVAPPSTNDGGTTEAPQTAPYAAIPTSQAAAPRAPRAFRTPERAGDQAFVPPQGGGTGGEGDAAAGSAAESAAEPAAPGQRSTSGVVIFRATGRTAIEGFDIRVAYPQSLGRFTVTANQADCTGAAGAIVTASDRGGGELRLLVASAQALPLPFDVFCRFTIASGARLSAGDFTTRVAEVASDGKKADPALLLVDVVVR